MNVRKRGLALLMCICMIFTLLPFSALADATAQDDGIIYGKYSGTTWTPQEGLTAENDPYTNITTGANVEYSKTAEPVENEPNTYSVTLTIKSKTSETAPGASAVVLVIDSSGSMSGGKLKKALNAAKSFADNYGGTAKSGRYIAAVEFSNKASSLNFGTYINPNYWLDVADTNNLKKFKDRIDNWLYADGGTDLAYGLRMTGERFNDNTVKNISNRYAVVLTDGQPESYYDADPEKTATEAATQLRNKAEIYTVGVGLTEYTKNFLENSIASKADGKTYAYNVNNADDLNSTFSTIFQSIEQGISSGFTVTDPMGQHVTLDETSIKDNTATVTTENGVKKITWEPKTGTTKPNDDGSQTTTYTLTYKVTLGEVPEDGTYPLNMNTTLKFKDGETDKTLQFNVPGVYREAPKYTVTYAKGEHGNLEGQDNSGNVVHPNLVKGTATPAAPTVNADEGYYFTGWEPTVAKTVTDDAVYTAKYAKRNDLSYTVHYYLNGTTQQVKDNKVVDGKTFEEVVTETYATIDGYTFAGTADEQTKTITIGAGTNEIIFYYYKNVTVTPNNANKTYGEADPAEFTATVSGLIKETDSLTYDFTRAPGENVGGYEIHKSTGAEVQGYYKVTYETGVFNITKRDVTFTGETATKSYTGSTIELTDITNVGLLDGHYASNLTYSASGINVGGPYSGEFKVTAEDVKIIDAENNDVSGNYNVTLVPGSLTIVKADTVIVKITGKTDTKVYNGLNQTFTGYDFVIENNTNNAYKETDFSLKTGVDVTASGTNVGEYTMGLTADSFVNNNTNFDVEFVIVKDGSLTITKRPLTIIGESSDPSEITYDGKTHEYIKWSLSPATDNSGLVPGHQITGITYLLTGKNAGDYTGQFSGDAKIMSGEKDVTANYSIECAPGMMKIIPAEKIAVKIIGNHKEVWYNGQEQSVSGFTFEVADNTVTVELKAGHYAIAKGTNVKTYYMGLKSDDFTINHQNYKEVSVEIVDGYLTIKRHYTPNPPIMDEIIVEITGNSDSVVYDGAEHSVKGYTVKISDPRYTEKDFTFTGKAEASGVNAGTYEMGLKAEQFKNTNARFTNVKFVIKADGVLTITPKELTITAGSKTEYGPTPVTCDEWTVSGLVAGDKVESVKITGIQSVPGSSPNVPSDAVIKNAKGEDVTKNYAIKYVNGTLTMLEVLNKEDHFNYIIGTPEGLSLPTANVTRAEVATIFFRLMTDDARAKFDSLDNNFSDVAKGKWYNRAISTLAKAGIIKGDPAGTYRPGDPITRAEMAAIIARFGDFKEGGKTFSDISGHWAQKYIELAASNGWINGNPDGTFKPNNNITRAETVAMINRVLNRQTESNDDLLPVSQMTNWSDNMDTAKWYYRDMQEATNNHKAERVGNSMYEKWTEKLPDIDWASYQI